MLTREGGEDSLPRDTDDTGLATPLDPHGCWSASVRGQPQPRALMPLGQLFSETVRRTDAPSRVHCPLRGTCLWDPSEGHKPFLAQSAPSLPSAQAPPPIPPPPLPAQLSPRSVWQHHRSSCSVDAPEVTPEACCPHTLHISKSWWGHLRGHTSWVTEWFPSVLTAARLSLRETQTTPRLCWKTPRSFPSHSCVPRLY